VHAYLYVLIGRVLVRVVHLLIPAWRETGPQQIRDGDEPAAVAGSLAGVRELARAQGPVAWWTGSPHMLEQQRSRSALCQFQRQVHEGAREACQPFFVFRCCIMFVELHERSLLNVLSRLVSTLAEPVRHIVSSNERTTLLRVYPVKWPLL